MLVICLLMLASCGHEHAYAPATLDTPATCECGETEGVSIREMLKGDWREAGTSSIYLCVEFTETGFNGNIVINGEKTQTLASTGRVEMEGNTITLWENNGKKYIYYNYEMSDGEIKLVDYEGKSWVRVES